MHEAQEAQAREAWRRRHERDSAVPCARAFDVQARTHRDRYDSMARPASRGESAALLAHLDQNLGIESEVTPFLDAATQSRKID